MHLVIERRAGRLCWIPALLLALIHQRRGIGVLGSSPLAPGGGIMPLDVLIAGNDEEAKETVAQLVRNGGLRAIDVGSLERARHLEGLGFLGMMLQQPLGLNFQSAWKLIS